MENPVGTDRPDPELSWRLESNDTAVRQTAYRIIVSESRHLLSRDSGACWDSKKVLSGNSIRVAYQGTPLASTKTYYWKVKVWDNKGNESRWSETARWKTGFIDSAGWGKAEWIAYPDTAGVKRIVPGVHFGGSDEWGDMKNVLPCFRKSFEVKKELASATAYISGLGHFEMSLNGRKTGNHFLDPGWTHYDRYALYSAFDLLPYLRPGVNTCGILLGNGFYHIPRERYRKCTVSYGPLKTIGKIVLEYRDGTRQEISTDSTWKCAPSAIVFSSIYGGEDYDARQEQKEWDAPGFDDTAWRNARPVTGPPSLRFQSATPLAVMDTFPVKRKFLSNTGRWIYDFGQNFSGIVKVKIKAEKGRIIRIWPAELLDEQNDITQRASGAPYYFEYTASGNEAGEYWQPRFTYYGFRYVMIENAVPEEADTSGNAAVVQQVKGLHTRNAARTVGTFHCSDQLFNRIFGLIDWSVRSNLASVVTDCPHREKLGWLEATHLMGNSIHYTYHINRLYAKIIDDMRASQLPDGLVPDIAPEYVVFDGGFRDSPEWGSAYVILPWQMYRWYGDKRPLTENYEGMKKYVAYLASKSHRHIVTHGLGDWFDLGPNPPGESQLTSKGITATAIYYYDVCILARAAELLGRPDDGAYYRSLADSIKASFNERYFDPQTKRYDTGSQTAHALALYLELVDPADKDAVFSHLINDLKKRDYNQTSGEIGFRFLLHVLQQAGESEAIFTMNHRTNVPGYGFQLAKGATSLTESWAALRYVSNNHCMLGHLAEWFYRAIGGIDQSPRSVAYRDLIIQPEPVGDLRFARTTFETDYGTVVSDWRRDDAGFHLQVEIPTNTTATVYFPYRRIKSVTKNGTDVTSALIPGERDRPCLRIGSGKYRFSAKPDSLKKTDNTH